MRTLRSLSARLDVPGLCLIAALAGACSFDESQLRPAPTPTPDGAIENPVLDASAIGSGGTSASSPDASTGVGGSRGSAETGGGGSTGVDDAAVPSDLAKTVDVGASGDRAAVSDGAPDGTAGTDSSPTLCSPVPKSTGGIACPGGKCTVGPYSGSASAFSDGVSSTICLSGNTLCAAGATNASKSTNTTINWGTAFGFNLSPNSTDTDLVGVQLSGSGISVTLSSLPTGAQARVQVMVGNAAYYCAAMSASTQTFPWASFNTACWNNSGTYLSGAPTAATSIAITVSSEAGVAGSFDLCVTSLAFPGSETCPTGYHDGGTGTCVLIGACSTGYHDGGGGACVASGTCSTGYHNGGAGTCVASGTCSTRYHDGGTGTCVVIGTCSTGYHDGGGGTCVVSGTCSAGYNNCSGTCSASSCGVSCPIKTCSGETGICTCG